MTYAIDVTPPSRDDSEGRLTQPDAHRIEDLRYDGLTIDPARMFVVVGNDYRSGGGGNFPGVDGKAIIIAAPDTNRDAIVRSIHAEGTINPTADGNWRLKSIPGTSVLFETSPKARGRLADLTSLHIEDLGEGEAGFGRFRIAW